MVSTESLNVGLMLAYLLRVIPCVPFDQMTSANQRMQGNKGRKGVDLKVSSVIHFMYSLQKEVIEFFTLMFSKTLNQYPSDSPQITSVIAILS